MDIIDNIIFANYYSPLNNTSFIGNGDFVPGLPPKPNPIQTSAQSTGLPISPAVFNFDVADKFNYCSFDDPTIVERAVQRHWYDVNNQLTYKGPNATTTYSSFLDSSTYHLIYAYLVENTRIIKIFERLIEKYVQDEELGIAVDPNTFNWIHNSEELFFKNDSPKTTNLRSLIRPSSDSSRRNAYMRMLGLDLAFGETVNPATVSQTYQARASNLQFTALFEKYLSEVWQGFVNARNTSGANTTDVNTITTLAQQLQELLSARRGERANLYAHKNLSREEFSAVFMTSWFAFVISYDSPVVTFLNCQSSTIGERLLKIGNKVGVQAHARAQSLFEMANSAAMILTGIEVGGFLDQPAWVQSMLSSLNPNTTATLYSTYMDALLIIINNWEKATGHRIKNPEANIRGTVKIAQPRPTNGKPVLVNPS